MKLFYGIILSLLSITICNAEIINRSFVLQENHFVDIENNTIDSIQGHGHLIYSTEIDSIAKRHCLKTSIDLAYQVIAHYDSIDCACIGITHGVTSSQPVYTIATQSEAIFCIPLDTMDTTISEKGNIWNSTPTYPFSPSK